MNHLLRSHTCQFFVVLLGEVLRALDEPEFNATRGYLVPFTRERGKGFGRGSGGRAPVALGGQHRRWSIVHTDLMGTNECILGASGLGAAYG